MRLLTFQWMYSRSCVLYNRHGADSLSLPPFLSLSFSHTHTPRTCNTSSCSHTPTANLPDLSTGDLLTPRLAEVTSKGPCSAKRVFPPGPRPAVGAHWCRVVSDCNLSRVNTLTNTLTGPCACSVKRQHASFNCLPSADVNLKRVFFIWGATGV